jgi:aryl-alcohol dehydrogenase-like predicted oxidoreductase
MEQIAIGTSGLRTSRVGLGTWAIGGWMWGGTDEAQSIATIRSAVERGVTLIDTAPVYGFGRSEEIVGKALAEGGLRETVQIATKLGVAWKDGEVFRDSRPTRIRQEIEDSLRRLRTDIIDLYQVHWPDLETCRDGTDPRGPVPRPQGLLDVAFDPADSTPASLNGSAGAFSNRRQAGPHEISSIHYKLVR